MITKTIMTVCGLNECNDCKACQYVCSRSAIKIVETISASNAYIDNEKCINCKRCYSVCPNIKETKKNSVLYTFQGWAINPSTRESASSGGACSAIAEKFVRDGGYVCSCIYSKGKFIFKCTNSLPELIKFAGSKYIKSDCTDAYRDIFYHLKKGERVLFIGLPCQCAGVLNVFDKYRSNLYTIDLICHGSPSNNTLQLFLKDHNLDINKCSDIRFRTNNKFELSVNKVKISKVMDYYLFAFLNNLIFTSNCYSCKFARENRVTDITLGDSWGSKINDEIENGISLILCSTTRGKDLITSSNIKLFNVKFNEAKKHNAQLYRPSIEPKCRKKFIKLIDKGIKFDTAVFWSLTTYRIKYIIKYYLKKNYR